MIAVTGGHTAIGSHLVRELVRRGMPVRVLGDTAASLNGVESISGDIFDMPALAAFLDGVETLFHLDSLDAVSGVKKRDLYRQHADGTANVVNAALAAGVQKLIYTNTVFALGDRPDASGRDGGFNEATRWSDPRLADAYAWSHHLAEREVWRGVAEGLPALVLHTGMVLAEPGLNPLADQVLDAAASLGRGYPPGLANFVDVRDVVSTALELDARQAVNESYIVTAPAVPYKDVLVSMSQIAEKRMPDRALSCVTLLRRARLMQLAAYLQRRNRPIMTPALAQVLCDRRSFSNSKIADLLACTFIAPYESLNHFRGPS